MRVRQFGLDQGQGALGQPVAELGAGPVQPGNRPADHELGGFQGSEGVLDFLQLCVAAGPRSPLQHLPAALFKGLQPSRWRARMSPRSANSARDAGRSRWRKASSNCSRKRTRKSGGVVAETLAIGA